MESTQRWRWLGLEFLVIVLGVLSALFVDTWMQEREDAVRAEVYRERLIADLSRDVANLDAVIDYYAQIRLHGTRVLADLEGDAPMDDFSLLFSAFNAAEEWGFVLEAATFSDMQSTGGLALIEDVPLRLDLADYYRQGASRAVVWALPRAFREGARGIIPNDLQAAIHSDCVVDTATSEPMSASAAPGTTFSASVEPLTGSADASGLCGLDPSRFQVQRAVRELRADTDLRRKLRFRISEIRVAISLFGGQRGMAEALIDRLTAGS
jgi:hypothetical protein